MCMYDDRAHETTERRAHETNVYVFLWSMFVFVYDCKSQFIYVYLFGKFQGGVERQTKREREKREIPTVSTKVNWLLISNT